MSHHEGTVYRGADVIGFFAYQSVTDTASTGICQEPRARWDWESEDGMGWRYRECTCGAPTETPVRLFTSYAGGLSWDSVACLTCMVITGERDSNEAECTFCEDLVVVQQTPALPSSTVGR